MCKCAKSSEKRKTRTRSTMYSDSSYCQRLQQFVIPEQRGANAVTSFLVALQQLQPPLPLPLQRWFLHHQLYAILHTTFNSFTLHKIHRAAMLIYTTRRWILTRFSVCVTIMADRQYGDVSASYCKFSIWKCWSVERSTPTHTYACTKAYLHTCICRLYWITCTKQFTYCVCFCTHR